MKIIQSKIMKVMKKKLKIARINMDLRKLLRANNKNKELINKILRMKVLTLKIPSMNKLSPNC